MAEMLFARLLDFLGADAPKANPTLERCRVQLVATPVGPRLPNLQGYHTSLLINSVEYSFSGRGVSKAEGPMSHGSFRGSAWDTTYVDYGWQLVDIPIFEAAMKRHFAPGTYDLLRKNCNSFSDTALQFLTGSRLDPKFRRLEALGRQADMNMSLVQAATVGGYAPNPRASGFDSCHVARACVWEVSGGLGGLSKLPLYC